MHFWLSPHPSPGDAGSFFLLKSFSFRLSQVLAHGGVCLLGVLCHNAGSLNGNGQLFKFNEVDLLLFNYKIKQEFNADFIKCSVSVLFADLKITFHKVSAQLTQWYTPLSCRASH